ncbi:hypothetical protein ACKWTF_013260 [Chironomus riparius]
MSIKYCIALFLIIFSTLTLQSPRRTKQSMLDVPVINEFFCNFSSEMQEMMYQNSSCKLTKVDRRINAINIYILLKEPVNVICIKSNLYFKKDGKYREVLSVPEIDFCGLGKDKQNGFLLQQFDDMAKKIFPSLAFKCPRSALSIFNVTVPSHPLLSFLPTGFYKLITFIRYSNSGPSHYNITTSFSFETYKERL